jgi:molybdate transport system ATP-binding protein
MKVHWAILINNSSNKLGFLNAWENGHLPQSLSFLKNKKGALFSRIKLERFMDEEERHDNEMIQGATQSLRSLSSGEQKRALLKYIFASQPDYVILDNPFDNLDVGFVKDFKEMLKAKSESILFLQIVSRRSDIMPFITQYAQLEKNEFRILSDVSQISQNHFVHGGEQDIPPPIHELTAPKEPLITFKDVHVSYGKKPVLNSIDWTVKSGEFWQLKGPNGSGKSTILSMITGDNPKAFGQNIYLFGKKKGSGESVWDIKQNMGYFSPVMTDKFRGRHSVEHMLISGLTDSVGLYVKPTEVQERYIHQWIHLLGLQEDKDTLFNELSPGNQRLVMTARSMVKHPPLLILDEPTAGLDDASAYLFVSLVNKFAAQSRSAIIFVSHRDEKDLRPNTVLELIPGPNGSKGVVHL